MYVYKRSEKQLWTVGYYDPNGEWFSESDHGSDTEAAERVHWLNGGLSGEIKALWVANNHLSERVDAYFERLSR